MGGNRQPDYDFIAPRPGGTQDQAPAEAQDRHLPPIPGMPAAPEQGTPGQYPPPGGPPSQYAPPQHPQAQPYPAQQYPAQQYPAAPYPPAQGFPPPQGYPQGYPTGPQGQVVPHPYLEPRRGGLPRWAIALIVGFPVLVVVALTALALPVFLGERSRASEWQDTTVALPATIGGLERQTGDDSMDSQLSSMGLPPNSLGVYGTGDKTMVVIAAKNEKALAAAGQQHLRDEIGKGFAESSKMPLDLHEAAAGPLGGYLGCSAPPAGDGAGGPGVATVCVATDSASVVMLVTARPVADPAALMRDVRSETVHRS